MDTNAGAKHLGYASLNDQQLSELVALEADLGVVILALKPSVPIANLTPDQIGRLQQLEKQHALLALACQK
jgi:hypothetical protein